MKTHLENKVKVCQYCGEKFSDTNNFKKHLMSHDLSIQR